MSKERNLKLNYFRQLVVDLIIWEGMIRKYGSFLRNNLRKSMAPFYKLSLYRPRKLQCSNKWISKDRKSETSLYSYCGEKWNRVGFKKKG